MRMRQQMLPRAGADTARLKPAKRMERAAEIALAKTAAPPVIADHASIFVLGPHGYKRVVSGTNGFGCIVQRTVEGSALIPRCDEASGVESLYAVFSLLEEMRVQGRRESAYRQAVAEGYKTGRFPRAAVRRTVLHAFDGRRVHECAR